MPMDLDYRLLTLSDTERAAHVIAQAFVNDPFYGVGDPLQAVA